MAQRYSSPAEHERMANYLCPECGFPPATHSSDMRFWVPRQCDLTRVGVQERIAQYETDKKPSLSPVDGEASR
jgi:hypothetical protein